MTSASPPPDLVTRREIDQRFEAMLGLIEQKFASLQRAVDKAEADQDRRNILNNEFRGQLKDQASTFVTRDYLGQTIKTVYGVVVTLITISLAIISLWFRLIGSI